MINSKKKKEFFQRKKSTQCDRHFLPQINANMQKSTDELVNQNSQFLISNDLNLVCQSINFFSKNIDSIDFKILTQLFRLDNQDCFDEDDLYDIQDCMNDLIESISKSQRILENTEYGMIIIKFLINFLNSKEKQFAVTSFESISSFIYVNKDIASFLYSNGFFNQCFSSFQVYLHELSTLDNDNTTEITDIYYLISSLLKVFSSLFTHQDLVTYEYSSLVIECYNYLLNIESPTNHVLKLKVLAFDNVYWFALSAPDASIQNLLTPHFVDVMLSLLNLKDDVKCSIFESIEKITSHGDQFSLLFLEPPIDLLNRMTNCFNWENKTKYSFIRILKNFSACQDISPSLKMAETPIVTEFVKYVLDNCSYGAQKEAFIVLFYMIMTNSTILLEYVLTNYIRFFPNLHDILNTNDTYFNGICLYSINICFNFVETKDNNTYSQFLEIFKDVDWTNLFDQFSTNPDENISKLAITLIDKIEK